MTAQGTELEGFEALHAEHEGKFAAVVDVVGHETPESPLARDGPGGAAPDVAVGLGKIANGPGGKGGVNNGPGLVEPGEKTGEVIGGDDLRILNVAVAVGIKIPGSDGIGELLDARGIEAIEPVDAAKGQVADEFANAAFVGGRTPVELIDGERFDGVEEAGLVAIPALEDGEDGIGGGGHGDIVQKVEGGVRLELIKRAGRQDLIRSTD